DYFVFLGDTMYETARTAAADPFADPAEALADYRRKYLENILPVKPGGFPGLQALFAAQGNYTLLDNHELGNAQFMSGGAPPGDNKRKASFKRTPAAKGCGRPRKDGCTAAKKWPTDRLRLLYRSALPTRRAQ